MKNIPLINTTTYSQAQPSETRDIYQVIFELHVKTTFLDDFGGLIFISGVRMRDREPVLVASQRGLYDSFFNLFPVQRHQLGRFHYTARIIPTNGRLVFLQTVFFA
jgi:hypothetical protein